MRKITQNWALNDEARVINDDVKSYFILIRV